VQAARWCASQRLSKLLSLELTALALSRANGSQVLRSRKLLKDFDLLGNEDGQEAVRRLAKRLRRRSPELQIMLVASPRNQLYLDHEVACLWRPLRVSGCTQHSRQIAL
jgi:hypothetical protein